jgi:hypothetical protein
MRGDVVFLAGMGARLVHDILQVLFALNECYYVGDGNNLRYVATFAIKPPAVEERITVALQILHDPEHQYRLFQELIADELGVCGGMSHYGRGKSVKSELDFCMDVD